MILLLFFPIGKGLTKNRLFVSMTIEIKKRNFYSYLRTLRVLVVSTIHADVFSVRLDEMRETDENL